MDAAVSEPKKNKVAPYISFLAGIVLVVSGALGYRYWKSLETPKLNSKATSNSVGAESDLSSPEQSIPMTKAELSGTAREALVSCLGSEYLSVTNIEETFQILKRLPGGLQAQKIEWENLYFVAEDGSERRVRFEANDAELHLDQIEEGGMPVPIEIPEAERSIDPRELLERYRKKFKVKRYERSASAEVAFENGSRAILAWRETDEGAGTLKLEAPDRELHCEPDPEQPYLQLCGCQKKGEESRPNEDSGLNPQPLDGDTQ